MGISIQTPGVHHISLRVGDFERSKQFYTQTLGLPVAVETDDLCVVLAGNTALGLRAPVDATSRGGNFDPHRVGLDHVALTCGSEDELERVAAALRDAGIENTGVKMDPTLGKKYVAFKDPDRIAWEFYMA
jgi:catechol 2,3-dioxygenase-like lactoylglutathione lyase family enzyme